jgi:hypothetical protein
MGPVPMGSSTVSSSVGALGAQALGDLECLGGEILVADHREAVSADLDRGVEAHEVGRVDGGDRLVVAGTGGVVALGAEK